MARLLQPANIEDHAGYEGLRTLLNTKATNTRLDTDPAFQNAEDQIIDLIPDATDRNHANREDIVGAFIFGAAANILEGAVSRSAAKVDLSKHIRLFRGICRLKLERLGAIV